MTGQGRKCWAATLGDCGGGMSREHIISASQFESDGITISGLPWCRDPRQVGLASLVAKNLCRNHNTALSPVDAEAAKFREAVSALVTQPAAPMTHVVDARLVERWLLKTTINLALQSREPALDVSEQLVRLAYGFDVHTPGRGFFFVAEEGERITFGGGIHFGTYVSKLERRIVLAWFRFHGCRLVYAFEHAPPVRGAFRLREWKRGARRLQLNWAPELAEGDRGMPDLDVPESWRESVDALARGEP